MIRYLDGNRVTLLRSGAQHFPALEHSIEQARAEIHLETYIFADDQTGRTAADSSPKGTQRAALLVRDNIRHRADIEDAYLEAIDADLGSVYSRPHAAALGRLRQAALIGGAQCACGWVPR